MSETGGWWLVVGGLVVYAGLCWGLLVWQRRVIRGAFRQLDVKIDSLVSQVHALIARLEEPGASGRG